MPVKKTPDGRIIEEKTKVVNFGDSDKTKIVSGHRGRTAGDKTVLSSGGISGSDLSGRDALDDKTKLVGRHDSAPPLQKSINAEGGHTARNSSHLGGTKPIGSPSSRLGDKAGVAISDINSPKTKLVRSGAKSKSAPEAETDDPVAGWLVIEKGPGKGQSVTLGIGMNTVGRGKAARARLDFGDDMLSAEKHFLISFDPRSLHFAIHLGDSANLTYLNGAPVYSMSQLSNLDVIEAGQTQLRFVAFCGEHFSWDD